MEMFCASVDAEEATLVSASRHKAHLLMLVCSAACAAPAAAMLWYAAHPVAVHTYTSRREGRRVQGRAKAHEKA